MQGYSCLLSFIILCAIDWADTKGPISSGQPIYTWEEAEVIVQYEMTHSTDRVLIPTIRPEGCGKT